MEPIVLGRSDIGFGKVTIDDNGVRRRHWFSTDAIAWGDIAAYTLSIEMLAARPRTTEITVEGIARGLAGRSPRRFHLELMGRGRRVFFNWRFTKHAEAIRAILDRIEPSLVARARAALARDGFVDFGRLQLRADTIAWAKQSPLAKADVEAIELFDSTTVTLRIMQRDKALSYETQPTSDVPNIGVALTLAEELGFPLRGRELMLP